MRGEKPARIAVRQIGPGSPPHARGKGALVIIDVDNARITPACAGKSLESPEKSTFLLCRTSDFI